MKRFIAGTTAASVGVVLIAGATLGGTPADDPLKCGSATEPVFAVDGVIIPAERAPLPLDENGRVRLPLPDSLGTEDILSLEIRCMHPVTLAFVRGPSQGVTLQNVISIWTKNGPASKLEPALATILAAQQSHFEKHGRYIAALDDIAMEPLPDSAHATLRADSAGWSAAIWIDRLGSKCHAYEGESHRPYVAIPPARPTCVPN